MIDNPILRDDEKVEIRQVDSEVFKAHTIDHVAVADGVDEVQDTAIERICAEAVRRAAGANILIGSRYATNALRCPRCSLSVRSTTTLCVPAPV